ncbi:hypothetical protein [Desulfonema magnum]|uniref:Core-binding (CB) domain-containing protein n=1 Tax=Desulfonema magnum TaxID=45655 RepID=A0A975BP87_9BACT|nr:hypothetical protein [Desulfonema magnum]QTA88833.1 Uncharacterized protein dnm_048800 [Desulfonema magnum]
MICRKWDCRYYDGCLEKHSLDGGPDDFCKDCGRYVRIPTIDIVGFDDIESYYFLLDVIFSGHVRGRTDDSRGLVKGVKTEKKKEIRVFLKDGTAKPLLSKFLRTKSQNNEGLYRSEVVSFFSFLGCSDYEGVTGNDFERYKAHLGTKGLKQSTLKTRIRVLKSFLSFVEKSEKKDMEGGLRRAMK